jgi:hypothetical protein
MYDFTRCVKHKDRIYCWDRRLKQFVGLTVKPLATKECPECVIEAFMRGEDNIDEALSRIGL